MTKEEIAAQLDVLAAAVRALPSTIPSPPVLTVQAGENLQAVLDQAPAGASVELAAGAMFTGNFVFRKAVTVTTAGLNLGERRATPDDAPAMARLAAVNTGTVIDILPGTEGVTIRGVLVQCGAANDGILVGHADSSQTTREQQPRNIALDQLVVEGPAAGGLKRGIALHGVNVTVSRSTVREVKRVGQDTQAIGGWNGEGPFTITDNYLEGAAETIMFGGANPPITGLIPADILIEGNLLTKNLAWRGQAWTIKNGLELKAGKRVSIRNNVIENVWVGGQGGYAIVLTPQGEATVEVSDITIEKNILRNVGGGLTILGKAQIGASQQTQMIVIRDNWMQISKVTNGGHGWPLSLAGGPRDVTVDHNTIETDGNQIVFQDGSPVEGFTFTGNLVLKSGAYGFTGKTLTGTQHWARKWIEYFPGGTIEGNAFGSFPNEPQNLPGNLHLATSAVTVVDGIGTGAVAGYGRRP
jgi:hypothetical protein